MTYPNRLIDKRVVERYIAKGMVDPEEYQALLDALPDMEDNATTALSQGAEEPAAETQAAAESADSPDHDNPQVVPNGYADALAGEPADAKLHHSVDPSATIRTADPDPVAAYPAADRSSNNSSPGGEPPSM